MTRRAGQTTASTASAHLSVQPLWRPGRPATLLEYRTGPLSFVQHLTAAGMDEGAGHDDRFEWDEFNLESAQRHGISWVEIEEALDNRPYVDRFGYDRSRNEVIYRALGRVPISGRLLSMLYVLRRRGRDVRIRVFHAMDMKVSERRLFQRQRGSTD